MLGDLKYAYLIGNGIIFVVWMLLFILRPDLRRKMIFMSLYVAPFGPISELFYLRDYWHPLLFNGWAIGIEDLLFAFFFGGISGVLYEEIFGRHFTKRRTRGHPIWMFGLTLFGIAWMIVVNVFLGLNSIYASILGFAVIGTCMIWFRHDLLKDAFFSSLLTGVFLFIAYSCYLLLFPNIFQSWWYLHNLSEFSFIRFRLKNYYGHSHGDSLLDLHMNLQQVFCLINLSKQNDPENNVLQTFHLTHT